MDSLSGISYYLNKCWTRSNTSQMTFFLSGRQRIGAHALCVQHSPTAAALSTSFLSNHVPQQPRAEGIDYKIEGVAWGWVVSQKRLKKSSSNWLNSGNALIHDLSEKMRFSRFPVLPDSAEAHVIWGGIVVFFWFVTLWVIFLQKNIKMRSRMS